MDARCPRMWAGAPRGARPNDLIEGWTGRRVPAATEALQAEIGRAGGDALAWDERLRRDA
jgi:hypothetical protein